MHEDHTAMGVAEKGSARALTGATGPGVAGDVVVALAEPEAAQTTIATSAADIPTACHVAKRRCSNPRAHHGVGR